MKGGREREMYVLCWLLVIDVYLMEGGEADDII